MHISKFVLSCNMQAGRSIKDIGPILKNPSVYQRGYGIYYMPRRRQYGRGFGSIFNGLARFFKPLLVRGLKTVGREVLDAGGDILSNIDKESVGNLVKSRTETALNNLKWKAKTKLEPLMQEGEGRKRRKKVHIGGRITKKKKIVKRNPIKSRRKRKSKHLTSRRRRHQTTQDIFT